MKIIHQILKVLGGEQSIPRSRMIVPEGMENGDFVVREVDLGEDLRGKDEQYLESYLCQETRIDFLKVKRDGEFVQIHVPLEQLLVAMGRASWRLEGEQSIPPMPADPSPMLPEGDPINEYRARVLLEAAHNVRILTETVHRPWRKLPPIELPFAWIEKCKKVIAVMNPEIPIPEREDEYLEAIIKLGLIEIPIAQPIHPAPTTEFNPAVKLHNSMAKSAALVEFGQQFLDAIEPTEMDLFLAGFPLESLGKEADLRRLAKALLRLAIETPGLAEPARLPRVMHLLHENVRSISGLWSNSRLLLREAPQPSRILLHLLKTRQELMEDAVSALSNSSLIHRR